MNNQDLPIKTKTPKRILAIARVKSNKSYDLTKNKFTSFWDDLNETIKNDFQKYIEPKSELGYLLYFRNDSNWTLLTSHKLIGKKDDTFKKIELRKIKKYDFGVVKNTENTPLILKVRTRLKHYKFEYESNAPGFALMVSLDFIYNHWRRDAIIN